ncbi:MAG: acyltransferase [Flavitalea sp.]
MSLLSSLVDRTTYWYSRIIGKPNIYFKRLGLKVGKNCRIYTSRFGSEPYLITIGNNVTITSGVCFITHDGSGTLMRDEKGRRYVFQPIEIGNNVFVGVNSILLPGVKIEDNVIVAAGSVVTKSIPSGSIVAGVPARITGTFNDLKLKMLNGYVSDNDMRKIPGTEDEKIIRLVTNTFKPYMTV